MQNGDFSNTLIPPSIINWNSSIKAFHYQLFGYLEIHFATQSRLSASFFHVQIFRLMA